MKSRVVVDGCTLGCINNKGLLKLKPQYQKLYDLLYEFGTFGINPPEAGAIIKDFGLPVTSRTTMMASASAPGFLKFTRVEDAIIPEDENPFYDTDEDYVLIPVYPMLITEFEWESDEDVELIFMSQPYTSTYYNIDYVYPVLDINSNLMIVRGRSGTIRTQDYMQNLFIHTNKACNLKINMTAIIPKEYQASPDVGDVPIPTNTELCGKTVPVAWSVLDESSYVVYSVDNSFKELAGYIKRSIEYYRKPNPLLQPLSRKVVTTSSGKVVIIWQNIPAKSYSAGTQYWINEANATDQFNSPSPYRKSPYGLGPIGRIYAADLEYPLIQCTLCVPLDSPTQVIQLAPLRMDLVVPTRSIVLNTYKDKNQKRMSVENLKPITSFNSKYAIYGATFGLNDTRKAAWSFCPVVFPDDSFADFVRKKTLEWKIKMTFKSLREDPPPMDTLWDPFGQIDTPFGVDASFTPGYEFTIGNALLVGGGGGGYGSAKVQTGDSSLEISGGGGGRGNTSLTGNFLVGEYNTLSNSYVNKQVNITIGSGGKGGDGSQLSSIIGQNGGTTTLSVENTSGTTFSSMGGTGASGINGADNGGGGGSAKNQTNAVSYGTGGQSGNGQSGNNAVPGKGGEGGFGPTIIYPSIDKANTRGKLGTTSPIPAGGGAGGVTSTQGVRYGGGGSGSDYTTGTRVAENGEAGLVVFVSRYIAY